MLCYHPALTAAVSLWLNNYRHILYVDKAGVGVRRPRTLSRVP
jgi:hypothetical protein